MNAVKRYFGYLRPPGRRTRDRVKMVLASDYDALLADLKKLGDPLALERMMEERDRYKAALRRIYFLDHNEREWKSVEEVKAFARAVLKEQP